MTRRERYLTISRVDRDLDPGLGAGLIGAFLPFWDEGKGVRKGGKEGRRGEFDPARTHS